MKRVALVALVLLGLCSSSIQGQRSHSKSKNSAGDVLSRQIEFTAITNAALAEAFALSLSDARAPGGVVKIQGCEPIPVLRYYPAHTSTLRDTLDFIVQSEPDYDWSLNDGVFNLLPKSGEPALLQTRISKLEVKDAESIHLPLSKLMSLPEVQKSIAQLGLSQAATLLLIPISLRPDKPRYTVDCQNVTLREALNTIARVHGSVVWRYAETRCNGKTEYALDFVVDRP